MVLLAIFFLSIVLVLSPILSVISVACELLLWLAAERASLGMCKGAGVGTLQSRGHNQSLSGSSAAASADEPLEGDG